MTEFNLPEPDDAPWLNLSPQEIEELRTSKKELTEYGKEKICKLMNKEPTHEEMLEEAARRELANKEFKDNWHTTSHKEVVLPYNTLIHTKELCSSPSN